MAYVGNPLLTTNYIADTFSGTGSQTTFIMSQAPANVNGVIVFVNNQAVYPLSYSVVNTQLIFSVAPAAGTNNISVRYLGAAGTPYVPGPLSVQNSMIAPGFVLPVNQGGTGAITLTGYLIGNGTGAFTTQATIPNSGLTNSSLTITAGTGLSGGGLVALGGSVTLNNTGVISFVAGTGLSTNAATGAITVNNTGVTNFATGTGLSVNSSTGSITLSFSSTSNGRGTRTVSTASPSGGVDGDVWYQYSA